MRRPRDEFSRMEFYWATNTTNALRPWRKDMVTLVILSTSVLSVKNGTQTTQVPNAKGNGHACGVRQTISTGTALIFKAKTEKMQNVQTAMKHILPGPRPAQSS